MEFKFPDPDALWDAYCARKDEEREAELERGFCGNCAAYVPAPRDFTRIEFGWCGNYGEYVEHDDSPLEYGCEDYEAAC